MYTSAHILVHLQNINGKDYVRIISVSNTDTYVQELKTAYGQDIDKQDDYIHCFYNCGDLYDRLINDLEFKKFKDVQSVLVSKGLWQIKTNVDTFFKTYISWIRARFNMYIEDLDETYFNLHTIKWCEVEIKKYVEVKYDLECTNFVLKDCEATKDGKFVFTRDHFASLVTYYTNCRHKNVGGADVDPLSIADCEFSRGFILEKTILSTTDVKQILDKVGICEVDLEIVEKNKDFIYLWDKEFACQTNNLCEYNPFGGRYSFLDGSKEPKLDDFFTLIIGTGGSAYRSLKTDSGAAQSANVIEMPSLLEATTSKALQDAIDEFNSQCEKSSAAVKDLRRAVHGGLNLNGDVPHTTEKALVYVQDATDDTHTTYDEFPRLQKSSMTTSNANVIEVYNANEVPSKLKATTSKAIQDAMNLFNSQCEKSSRIVEPVHETQPVKVPSTASKALQDAISLLYSQCEKSNEPGIDLPRVTDKELQLFSSDAIEGLVCNVKPISNVKEDQYPIEQTKHIYKSLITKTVCAFDSKLKLLNEFVTLDVFTYYQPFTKKVIESLEEISKSKLVIEELKTLIAILEKSVDPNEDDASGSNKQKTLTEQYVKINKNDNEETPAAIVIDNVFSYLSLLKTEQINKNQIGKDLVDLGVKKTRKTKGFVYGLLDSMHRKIVPANEWNG